MKTRTPSLDATTRSAAPEAGSRRAAAQQRAHAETETPASQKLRTYAPASRMRASPREDMGDRVVLHADVDGFYCACEVRRRPELRGKALAVTQFNSGGFVALSEEAVRAGIRKGDGIGAQGHQNLSFFKDRPDATMDGVLRKCPGITILPMDTEWYRTCSEDLLDVLTSFRDDLVVEKASIDDFFIDASAAIAAPDALEKSCIWQEDGRTFVWGNPESADAHCSTSEIMVQIGPRAAKACALATRVRARVREELGGMTISVGIGPNKLLARLVSKRKLVRDAQTIVVSSLAPRVAESVPLRAVPGLKGKLGSRLQDSLGIEKLADLLRIAEADLERIAPGKVPWLRDLAACRDASQVIVRGPRKSIMTERSFAPARLRSAACQDIIRMLCADLLRRLAVERRRRQRTPHGLAILWRRGYETRTMESRRLSPFPCAIDDTEQGSSRLARIVNAQLPETAADFTRIALNSYAFEPVQARSLRAMFEAKTSVAKREASSSSSAPTPALETSSSSSAPTPALEASSSSSAPTPAPESASEPTYMAASAQERARRTTDAPRQERRVESPAAPSAQNKQSRAHKRQRTLDSYLPRAKTAKPSHLGPSDTPAEAFVVDLVSSDSDS